MDVFTSIALNYLAKARVLASTLKISHPNWKFHLYIADSNRSDFSLRTSEPFDSINWVEDLDIKNIRQWIFKHTIVELCTAVKGHIAHLLLRSGAEKVIYLDPDIAVFNPLHDIERLLDRYPILLTPHLLEFENSIPAIMDNEVCSLKHGVFNLGFFAVNNQEEGMRFANWFEDRLLEFCHDEIQNGLFTDQKWCDLAPAFFPNLHILRDPGCNVASWNLSKRSLAFSPDGTILVNGSPLRFYHFTGYDSGAGSVMTRRYGNNSRILDEIWQWYRRQLEKHGQKDVGKREWHFGSFQNGQPIPKAARLLYRRREDLQTMFPDPFLSGRGSYHDWFMAQSASK